MKPIKGSINLSAIDKSKLFDGKKGKYLDIVLVPTPNGKYHDWMIVQNTSKDEESIILGNAGKKFDDQVPVKGATEGAAEGAAEEAAESIGGHDGN